MSQAGNAANRAGDRRARPTLGRQRVWLLIGLGVVVAFVYGVLAAALLGRRGRPVPTAPVTGMREALALSAAHEQALALAASWQADAQLVGVTTSWLLAAGDRLTMYRPAWSFRFFSAAAGQVQILTVNERGAQALQQIPIRGSPAAVEADWSLGSEDLMMTFLASGGEAFLQSHGQANIHFSLERDGEGRSMWSLIALDPAARESLIVGVDALSHEVVFVK